MSMSPPAIALNRFGLGARPDEAVPGDPKAWLRAQLGRFETRPPAIATLPGTREIAARYRPNWPGKGRPPAPADKAARVERNRAMQALYHAAINARAESALVTPAPFVERLVHFWSNHFAVSVSKPGLAAFAGAFEAEAIRPHVLGRFEDLLLAAERHIAMQLYLDQASSVGPSSRFATRGTARNGQQQRPGLNENLAREIMELHTLGVRSGYSQADVTEFARAMTGWGVAGYGRGSRLDKAEPGTFLFRQQVHEPGPRTILGKTYGEPGEGQALAVLRDLAASPATARHLAGKLARHFAGDTPPPALVDRLAAAFTANRGDLASLYRALIDAPESWAAAPAKFKTPWEWLISAMRGTGYRSLGGVAVGPTLVQLGQPVWRPGSPAGYDDVAASWIGPDALLRRVEVAQRIASRLGDDFEPRALASKILPGAVGPATAGAIAQADSVATGIALLLVSPDFQRR
ncbi:MAG TPA: DUF1800 domain-containing protein [Allosphingosinicella sp.]